MNQLANQLSPCCWPSTPLEVPVTSFGCFLSSEEFVPAQLLEQATLAQEAGFSSVRRLPLENPFNSLYELKP